MALSPQAFIKGLVGKLLPSSLQDSNNLDQGIRLGRYGEPWSQFPPTRHGLAEEGTYLVATNPTIGTGMTNVAAQTAYSDTTPNIYIQNNESASNPNAKSIYLDFFKFMATQAMTAATSISYAGTLDMVARAITTNHVTTITPVNPNGNVVNIATPLIQVQSSATASVIAASSAAARIVTRGNLGGLTIAGDELQINFGSTDAGGYAPVAEAAGQPGRRVSVECPVIIGPGQSYTFQIWAPSSSASLAPEFVLGMWCR